MFRVNGCVRHISVLYRGVKSRIRKSFVFNLKALFVPGYVRVEIETTFLYQEWTEKAVPGVERTKPKWEQEGPSRGDPGSASTLGN